MLLTRAVKIKLNSTSSKDLDILKSTISSYTDSYNYVCKFGFSSNINNSIALHKQTYSTLRPTLPSQLVISSRAKASESLKSISKKKKNLVLTLNPALSGMTLDPIPYI